MSGVKMEMEMGGEEMEAVMERAWDLHDRISDAILSLSKSHFIHSIRKKPPSPPPPSFSAPGNQDHGCLKHNQNAAQQNISNGAPGPGPGPVPPRCADFLQEEDLFAETRSLNAIRNALEVLENQLYFLHTLQLQQRADKDAALMRLEESRLMLLRRLREHRGRELTVIQEALAFASDRDEAEDIHSNPRARQNSSTREANKAVRCNKNEKSDENSENLQNKCQTGLACFLNFSIQFMKNSEPLHRMAGVVAKVALIAVSMLTVLQLQQTTLGTLKRNGSNKSSRVEKNTSQFKRQGGHTNIEEHFPKHSGGEMTKLPGQYSFKNLDVLFGRG